jgi:hypothetical protein
MLQRQLWTLRVQHNGICYANNNSLEVSVAGRMQDPYDFVMLFLNNILILDKTCYHFLLQGSRIVSLVEREN